LQFNSHAELRKIKWLCPIVFNKTPFKYECCTRRKRKEHPRYIQTLHGQTPDSMLNCKH